MSVVSESLRKEVDARAGRRCEYCHVSTEGQVATFPIDHVVPQNQGGATSLDNLAMACPRCNGHKWKYSDGTDLISGKTVPLFNPRRDRWTEHFAWSGHDVGLLEAKTEVGRATLSRLQMNHPDQISIRKLLASLGLFPEVLTGINPSP